MAALTTTPNALNSSVIAVYGQRSEAEAAVKALQRQAFDMSKLSIVGKDYQSEEHVAGYYTADDRMMTWGKYGAFWGGLWGLLFGAAFFVVPGFGPVGVAGPFIAWIEAALEGALLVGGLSVLGAALVSIGVLTDSALKYETEMRAGKSILIVHGSTEEIDRARALLELTRHEGLQTHLS